MLELAQNKVCIDFPLIMPARSDTSLSSACADIAALQIKMMNVPTSTQMTCGSILFLQNSMMNKSNKTPVLFRSDYSYSSPEQHQYRYPDSHRSHVLRNNLLIRPALLKWTERAHKLYFLVIWFAFALSALAIACKFAVFFAFLRSSISWRHLDTFKQHRLLLVTVAKAVYCASRQQSHVTEGLMQLSYLVPRLISSTPFANGPCAASWPEWNESDPSVVSSAHPSICEVSRR